MKHHSLQRGFSLIEVLIVIAIAAIMATIAVPDLISFVNLNRINSLRGMLLNDFSTARSEAIKSNVRVAICAANSTATDCSTSSNWATNGWLICNASGAGCDTTASAIVVRPTVRNNMAVSGIAAVIFRPIGTAVAAGQINLSGPRGAQSGVISIATTGTVTYTKY